MNGQNLAYALVQVLHNFGAATVVGCSAFAVLLPSLPLPSSSGSLPLQRKLARAVTVGWVVQGASGASFGAISYFNYGQFPDIHGIAVTALWIKVICVVVGLALAVDFLRKFADWEDAARNRRWHVLFGLAATALSAAAFLRWFS